MRLAILLVALSGFATLALYDLAHGEIKVGFASLLLVVVNGLLLS